MIYKVPVGEVDDVHFAGHAWTFRLRCGWNEAGGATYTYIAASIIAGDEKDFAFSVPDDAPLTCCEHHKACAIKKEET